MESKNIQLNICYNCMRKLDIGAHICPSCGYNNDMRSNPENVLPEGTILFRKYLVGRTIGRGGFGVTYVGYDLDLQLKVAIKEYFPAGVSFRSGKSYDVISESSSAQDHTAFSKGCEAFLDEARMLASVNSPYIVHVRDFFREHGTAYIVMDYVEGQTLPQAMQENGGRLDALRVIRLMLPLIEQLDELHERNIIHRDIKPDNIMLVQDRRGEHLVLLDFGAARSFISGNVSKTYTAVVTPGFAPLEQYSQRSRQGAYTDVYGLCATIYYAITGVIPPTATERSSDDTPIRPFRSYGIAVSGTVEAAIMHGLALRSTDRTQTMHELYEELTANTDRNRDTSENNRNTLKEYTPRYAEQRKPSHTQRTGSTRRKKKKSTSKKAAISLLILCLTVLAGSGVYLFVKRNNIPQPASIPVEPEPTQIEAPNITQSPQSATEQTDNKVQRNIKVGDYITFGSYEQDNNLTNGKEPIEWIALEVQDKKILLLSRYALDCKAFNNLNTATSWPTCSLNSWLNYSFLRSAFTDQEAGCIEDQEKIFLLSREDVIRYFPNNEDRKCYTTEFAKSNGAYISESENTTLWWLSLNRKSRNMRAFAPVVDAKGTIISSRAIDYKHYTVRPALWADIEKVNEQTANDDRSEII